MIRGYWRPIIAFGLVAASALGAGGWVISEATESQTLIEQEAAQKAAAYAYRARIRIERDCVRLSSAEKHECVHEAAEAARKGAHDERNLEAQLVTSVWTHYMGLAAIGGTAFGIIGIFLVLGTFRENKRVADAAHDANRPWIEVSAKVKDIWAGHNGASADIDIKMVNRGNSPATDVSLLVEMMPFPAGQLADTGPILGKMNERLRNMDSRRPHSGAAIFPDSEETDVLIAEVGAEVVAVASDNGTGALRYLVAVGTSYMFGEKHCHTVKCYDICVSEQVDYVTAGVFHRVRFKEDEVTDTYRGFAT
jgi:hypothetical protein